MSSASAPTGDRGRSACNKDPLDPHGWWARGALAAAALVVVLAVIGPPPMDLHGPLHYLGIMDPLCGATRSVYLTTRGELGAALRYNPAAPLVPVALLVVLGRAAIGRLFGRWIIVHLPRRLAAVCVGISLIALEINQQSHAALLTTSWPTPG